MVVYNIPAIWPLVTATLADVIMVFGGEKDAEHSVFPCGKARGADNLVPFTQLEGNQAADDMLMVSGLQIENTIQN